jgi:DNA-binding GntR family transcriptional regulator
MDAPQRSPAQVSDHDSTEAKRGTVDHVVAEIVRALYEGSLLPGQKLRETELMLRLKVGRSTVREAINRLAADGLLTVNLHRGASIRHLSRKAAEDFIAVAENITTLCARLAAKRLHDPADRRMLEETLDRLSGRPKTQTPFEFAQTRDGFFQAITRISDNDELARMFPLIQAHVVRVQFPSAYEPARHGQRLESYAAIIRAILANDGPGAERAMRRHARATARAILALPDSAFAPSTGASRRAKPDAPLGPNRQ